MPVSLTVPEYRLVVSPLPHYLEMTPPSKFMSSWSQAIDAISLIELMQWMKSIERGFGWFIFGFGRNSVDTNRVLRFKTNVFLVTIRRA